MYFFITLLTNFFTFCYPFLYPLYPLLKGMPTSRFLFQRHGLRNLPPDSKHAATTALNETGPTELSSDTKTPDDHRLLKAPVARYARIKRRLPFTNTCYRLPLPRPTLGRGTPSPLTRESHESKTQKKVTKGRVLQGTTYHQNAPRSRQDSILEALSACRGFVCPHGTTQRGGAEKPEAKQHRLDDA